MKNNMLRLANFKPKLIGFCFIIICVLYERNLAAQSISIQVGVLDGMEVSKDNLFNFQLISNLTQTINAKVEGSIRYKQIDYRIQYMFETKINPGTNSIEQDKIHPTFDFSSTGLRELFTLYNTLPSGTYEYCISVTPYNNIGEIDLGAKVDECMYYQKQETFLINLIEPENTAKIYEKNPSFTWIANYSFSNELTYKIRIAEIKQGQNSENAIVRNRPIYEESNLRQNTLLYPLTSKPLDAFQPYAWTVDCYYKNILLGSAEPWRFILVEDTLNEPIPKFSEFIDIRKETGSSNAYAVGELRIKYVLDDLKKDNLIITISDGDKIIKLKDNDFKLVYGDNRFIISLQDKYGLKHLKSYMLNIKSESGATYYMPFKYVNPEFVK